MGLCGVQAVAELPPCAFPGFNLRRSFHIYALDLRSSLGEIFTGFAKDSIQRKILRAERDGLRCEEGRSESLIERFYSLLVKTRRRHALPPQPARWFSNLVTMFGNDVKIYVVSMDRLPVGAIFTLRFKQTLVYKYACGEIEYFKHGPMQLLLWRAIQEAKADGLERLDFGRSDEEEKGLQLRKSVGGDGGGEWILSVECGALTRQKTISRHTMCRAPSCGVSACELAEDSRAVDV